MQKRASLRTLLGWMVPLLVVFSVCWRGGKTLEATWLLVIIAAITLWCEPLRYKVDKQLRLAQVPMQVWITGMAFIVWTVISFFLSSTKNYGLDEVLRDSALVLLFFWMARRICEPDGEQYGRRILQALTIATVIACVVGIAVYTLQPVNRFVGTFFDARFATDYWPNAWADLLLLAWPMVYVSVRKYGAWTAAIITGFVLGCLLLSFSRGAFLALIGQAALMGGLFFMITIIRAKQGMGSLVLPIIRTVLMAAIAVCVFLGVNMLRSSYYSVESVAAKATFTASEGSSSVTERRQFWDAAFTLSLQKPVFGWGPYSFRFVQPRLQTGVFETSDHPHNVFLKLAMERGWPAAIFFLILLVLVLLPSLLRAVLARGTLIVPESALLLPGIVAITGLIAHNMIDYNLQFVGIALGLWLLLGILASQQVKPQTFTLPTRLIERLLAVLLLIVVVIEGKALVTSSLGRRAEARGSTEEALKWYRASEGELYSRDMYLSRATLALQSNDSTDAIKAADLYILQNSEDARGWLVRGIIAESDKKPANALKFYDQARPRGEYNYLGITTGILRSLSALNDTAEIQKRKAEVERVYKAFGMAIEKNSHFIALSQNVEEFTLLSTLLQKLYPADTASYRAYTQKVIDHATTVRKQLGDTKTGILW